MALYELTTEMLPRVRGGLVAKMLDKHLKRMIQDIKAAPDLKDKRKVTLTIEMVPSCTDGQLDTVDYVFQVGDKAPSRACGLRAIVKYVDGQQKIVFNEDSQDNPNQQTLLPENEASS
jgi:hypothetical protein